jgi:hypothetical protein
MIHSAQWLWSDRDYNNKSPTVEDIACETIANQTGWDEIEIEIFILFDRGKPVKYWIYNQAGYPVESTREGMYDRLKQLCTPGRNT